MDKDTLKGKLKDAAGRAERQAGEWTDDKDLQSEGAGRQVEGKMQKGLGKLKEMGRDAKARVQSEIDKERGRHEERERQEERQRQDERQRRDKVA